MIKGHSLLCLVVPVILNADELQLKKRELISPCLYNRTVRESHTENMVSTTCNKLSPVEFSLKTLFGL